MLENLVLLLNWKYIPLFHEFRDVFAWSYDEIPGIDSSIVEHEIKMYPDVKLV